LTSGSLERKTRDVSEKMQGVGILRGVRGKKDEGKRIYNLVREGLSKKGRGLGRGYFQ